MSDEELVGRLREFLRTSDLTTTTTGTVRRQLEEDFGIDLSEKKAFIREQVDVYLRSHVEAAEEEGEGKDDDEEEEAAGVKSEEENEEEEEDVETGNGKGAVKRRLVRCI